MHKSELPILIIILLTAIFALSPKVLRPECCSTVIAVRIIVELLQGFNPALIQFCKTLCIDAGVQTSAFGQNDRG